MESVSSGGSVPFILRLDDDADASNGEVVNHGHFSRKQKGSSDVGCSGRDNSALQVTFERNDLLSARSGEDYQAVITLLVEPI